MAIPDFQTMMLPVLRAVAQRSVAGSKDAIQFVISNFKLTEEDQLQMLPSKTQRVIDNRVYWCLVHLQRAGLINRPARGQYCVADLGRKIIADNPQRVDMKFLMQFESYREFRALSKKKSDKTKASDALTAEEASDPRESLEESFERLKGAACAELLQLARKLEPTQFELLVVDLLKRMGYGVPGLGSVVHTGGPGDGGIDGEISQDRLGLDMIYVQAKRYQEDSTVGRPDIQKFVGSLNERKTKKGIFITTSHFADSANEYVQKVDVKVALIDGLRLAELMYDHGLGVVHEHTYEIKRVDLDYFALEITYTGSSSTTS